jgi:hypothetical protein
MKDEHMWKDSQRRLQTVMVRSSLKRRLCVITSSAWPVQDFSNGQERRTEISNMPLYIILTSLGKGS